jgi:hypothetical protein
MEFENLIGTTGIATYMDKLYVVNNRVIRVFDSAKHKDIPLPYDRVSGITLGSNTLFGIYFNQDSQGVFAMDLKTNAFRNVEVLINPVLIYFINKKSDGILLIDDNYQCYRFDKQLKIGEVVKTIPNETMPTQFMTFSMVHTDTNLFFGANDQILDMKTFIPLSLKVPGPILSMLYYMNNLFILYVSNYNQFSVLQYDPDLDQILATVDGGYLSGPPVYSCICKNNILVSASPNQIIPLTQFNLPLLNDPSDASMNNPYPLFDLPPSDARYIEDKLPLPIDALKNKVDTLELDTRPAQKQLAFSYLWTFFCLVVILVLIAVVFFQDPFIFRIGVAILVVSVLFMCSQYI